MQGTPNPKHAHQWKAERSSELSEGGVATSPEFSYLLFLSKGASLSSLTWMQGESIIQRERTLENKNFSGVQHCECSEGLRASQAHAC